MATKKYLCSGFWLTKYVFLKNLFLLHSKLSCRLSRYYASSLFYIKKKRTKEIPHLEYLGSPNSMFFPNHNTKNPIRGHFEIYLSKIKGG